MNSRDDKWIWWRLRSDIVTLISVLFAVYKFPLCMYVCMYVCRCVYSERCVCRWRTLVSCVVVGRVQCSRTKRRWNVPRSSRLRWLTVRKTNWLSGNWTSTNRRSRMHISVNVVSADGRRMRFTPNHEARSAACVTIDRVLWLKLCSHCDVWYKAMSARHVARSQSRQTSYEFS